MTGRIGGGAAEMFAPWIGQQRRPRVMLVGDRERAAARLDEIRETIAERADIVHEDLGFLLPTVESDFAVVLGGDGSMLRAAKHLGTRQTPVLGVNLGRLGFLAAMSFERFRDGLEQVCDGRCVVVEHLMFRCEVRRHGEVLESVLGLNEVAILGGPPFAILNVELYVDSELATTYSCDGLIVSTPIGSTAHSLSAGGPILRKSLQAFVIQPISPHTLTVRPVVDTADRTYEIAVPNPNQGTAVVVDGRVVCGLQGADRVRLVRATQTFQMIEVPGQNYYQTLREKLGWSGSIVGLDEKPQ